MAVYIIRSLNRRTVVRSIFSLTRCQTHCPRRSEVISPASRRTFRWYEIVGWESPNTGTLLHSHISFMCEMAFSMRRRGSSEGALNSLAGSVCFAYAPGGQYSVGQARLPGSFPFRLG